MREADVGPQSLETIKLTFRIRRGQERQMGGDSETN